VHSASGARNLDVAVAVIAAGPAARSASNVRNRWTSAVVAREEAVASATRSPVHFVLRMVLLGLGRLPSALMTSSLSLWSSWSWRCW